MQLTKEEWVNALKKRCGDTLYRKLSSSHVAICGLGGLGSNIAFALARSGIGKLTLIDYDVVDITNIHRQQYKLNQISKAKAYALKENILEFAPFTKINAVNEKITEQNYISLLQNADIICEAFDDAGEKAKLVNLILQTLPQKYIVAASGMAGLDSPNLIHTKQITPFFYLCGDEKTDVASGIGLVAPRVMLCAAHQALTVLRIIENLNI